VNNMPDRDYNMFQVAGFALALPFRHPIEFIKAALPWIGLSTAGSLYFVARAPMPSADGKLTVPLTWPLGLMLLAGLLTFIAFATVWLRVGFFSAGSTKEGYWDRLSRRSWRLFLQFIKLLGTFIIFGLVYILVAWLVSSVSQLVSLHEYVGLALLTVYAVGFIWVICREAIVFVSAVVDDEPLGLFDAWGYSGGHAFRIFGSLFLISLFAAVLKFGMWSAVANVDISFLLLLLVTPYQSSSAIMGGSAPMWFAAAETILTCLTMAWSLGALARIYRLIAPQSASDERVAGVF
jgi:hypothetical protein